jgi:hypothetical protein
LLRDLTKEQIAEYRAAFDMFDGDKDGQITPLELEKTLAEMGMSFLVFFLSLSFFSFFVSCLCISFSLFFFLLPLGSVVSCPFYVCFCVSSSLSVSLSSPFPFSFSFSFLLLFLFLFLSLPISSSYAHLSPFFLGATPTQEEIADIIHEFDLDGNGKIDFSGKRKKKRRGRSVDEQKVAESREKRERREEGRVRRKSAGKRTTCER